jgi:hypothetical protein
MCVKLVLTLGKSIDREFEDIVVREIFGPKKEEVPGRWRELRNEKLHKLYSSLNIIRVIKLKMMKWKGVRRTKNA